MCGRYRESQNNGLLLVVSVFNCLAGTQTSPTYEAKDYKMIKLKLGYVWVSYSSGLGLIETELNS